MRSIFLVMFSGSKHTHQVIWLAFTGCGILDGGDADPRIVYTAHPNVRDVSQLYVADADGGHREKITDLDGEKTEPAWSPDGSRIAFSWQTESQVFVFAVNADGSGLTRITPGPASGAVAYDGPAWSPNGNEMAFSWVGGGPVWIIGASGTGQRQVTPSNLFADDPAWSPDGSRLAFTARVSGVLDSQLDLHVINPDGTGLVNLTMSPGMHETNPAWSPDGSRIVFVGRPIGRSPDIWVIDASGQNPTQVTHLTKAFTASAPDWSPDGVQIVFSTGDGLSVVSADGNGTPKRIVGGRLPSYPDWR